MNARGLAALVRRHGWRRLAAEGLHALPQLFDHDGRVRLRDRWRRADAEASGPGSYAAWIDTYENDAYYAALGAARDGAPPTATPVRFAVLVPVFDPPEPLLREALDSVLAQTHQHWELCICDDASTAAHVPRVLAAYAERDARIKVKRLPRNGHISAASNGALDLAEAPFVVLLDHDDRLHPRALQCLAGAFARHPDANLIYSDEDRLLADGSRAMPYFKPDFNHQLLLAQNAISHLGCYRTALVRELGGFRAGLEGSQDWDLALRVVERSQRAQIVHVPRVLYHWRVSANSTAATIAAKPYARAASRRAVAEHLTRSGIDADVLDCPELPSANRVRFKLPSAPPPCTIVIPSRDNGAMLARCIASIRDVTSYGPLSILVVDNGSRDAGTLGELERLRASGVSVLNADMPFNFSRLNNLAVQQTETPFVCLLNDDVEAIDGAWLQAMVAAASASDVGIVGARLWYPDGRLQHAGVVLGMAGAAGHPHKGLARGQPGYFGRAVLQQEFSAVTAACMLVRRTAYDQLGGLDEAFPVAYGDVDFCLRARAAGWRVVWEPAAELLHHESATRGADLSPDKVQRLAAERALLAQRWGALVQVDPCYSPNLALDREDFSLAWPPRVTNS